MTVRCFERCDRIMCQVCSQHELIIRSGDALHVRVRAFIFTMPLLANELERLTGFAVHDVLHPTYSYSSQVYAHSIVH